MALQPLNSVRPYPQKKKPRVIGIIDIEPKIFNTAYMKIAGYHRKMGNYVEWYNKDKHDKYDNVYLSALFNFTKLPDDDDKIIRGGSGISLSKNLPDEIERSMLDYSIYPKCDTSYVWFSRGCIRKCGFCIVPEKEGDIKSVRPSNLNPTGRYITVVDNNFFANPNWRLAIDTLRAWGQPVDFMGVDARLMNEEHCKAINSIKIMKRVKIAWDNPKSDMTKNLDLITTFIRPYKLMCYVLIGYDSTIEEDIYRVKTLWFKYRIPPFVMAFDPTDTAQRRFRKWVNGYVYKNVEWEDYEWVPKRGDI